jgi:hypothetical protein
MLKLTFSFYACASNAIIDIPLIRKPGLSHKQRRMLQAAERDLQMTPTEQIYSQALENWDNYQYVGQLWLGSHQQQMKFIFDTGSAWTWVPNSDCTGCPGNHYNYALSADYYQSQYTKKIFYGVGSVKGYVVNDDITIAPPETGANAMAHNVNFISVYESEDLFGLMSDGLLGLSPRKANSG